jgi:hypothetical protein
MPNGTISHTFTITKITVEIRRGNVGEQSLAKLKPVCISRIREVSFSGISIGVLRKKELLKKRDLNF